MKIQKTEIAFDGSFIQVSRVHFIGKTGKECVWEVVRRKTFGKIAAIFALTEKREVILEKSFRVPFNQYVIELPAGLMDKKDETPESLIARELREETGYSVGAAPERVLEGPFNAGLLNDELIIFFADNVKKVGAPMLEDAEDIEVLLVPLDSLVDFCMAKHSDFLVDIKILNVLPVLEKKGLI